MHGGDATCPFCGQRHRAVPAVIALMGLALGCGPVTSTGSEGSTSSISTTSSDGDATSSPSGGPGGTTMLPTGSTTFAGQTETGDDASSSTANSSAIYGGSIGDPDGGGIAIECSVWDQDCADGEKCMPWANDGGSVWNAARCVLLDDDPRDVGEPCTAQESFVSGIDTCEVGAVCIGSDKETLEGVCVELCGGSPAAPVCDETQSATCLGVDGVIPLCSPLCSPLVGDCADGEACLPGSDGWGCMTEGDIAPGGSCEFENACTAASVCIAPDASCPPGSPGCCASTCDTSAVEPDLDCPESQACAPFYGEGDAPMGYEDVGVCRSVSD